MKEIVVISGKGGTGKTSLVASFAALAEKPVVADCDVDAADLHLVLLPVVKKTEDFIGGKKAKIITEKCSGCGKCMELCRFDAVTKDKQNRFAVDSTACEGCSVCSYFCPKKAVEFKAVLSGRWFVSDTRYGPMVHARLGIAEENSGKLVALVRNQARMIAEKDNHPYVIIDGPPGIGCPVIASVTGCDAVLIVTEPTVSGEHDIERVAELIRHFGIPAYLCINRFDINNVMSSNIEKRAGDMGISVVGKIRYDRVVTEAQMKRLPVVALQYAPAAEDIKKTWDNLLRQINQKNKGA